MSRELFSTWYRVMRDGELWCETPDPDEARKVCRKDKGDELLKLETYLVSDGWQPWDGEPK